MNTPPLARTGGWVDSRTPVNWQHPLNRGLVSWWLGFGPWRGGGVARDLAFRHDGAVAADWAPAPGGFSGLNYNGTTQGVDCGAFQVAAANQLTVACWVRPNVLTRGDLVTQWDRGSSPGDSFNLLYGLTSGKPQFFVSDGSSADNSGAGPAAMTTDRFYHVAGVYTGAVATVYLNGAPQSSAAFSLTLPTAGTRSVRLGRNDSGTDGFANAATFSSVVVGRALSDAEVFDLYEEGARGFRNTLNWLRPWVAVAGAPQAPSAGYVDLTPAAAPAAGRSSLICY